MSSINQLILNVSNLIQKELDNLMPNGDLKLFQAMRYSVLSEGKRLRPFILITVADMFNVERIHSLRAAAAIEIVHSYSLIHDDLPAMDNDDYRRGMPSCHKKFDEATAILAGDSLLTLAFEILADEKTHFDSNIRCKLIKTLAENIGPQGMAGGQMYDLIYEKEKSPSYQELYKSHWMKTARLFMASCVMGAILGNASTQEEQVLAKFGEFFGLAFQFIDDLEDAQKSLSNNNVVKLLGVEETKRKVIYFIEQARQCLLNFRNKEILDGLSFHLCNILTAGGI